MNFNNSGTNNNRDNTPQVNTRAVQFMNKDGFFPSTLLIGYWNERVTLKIHPAMDPAQQTQGRVFNYDKNINTSLTLEKLLVLVSKIEADIIPSIDKGLYKDVFRGVPIGDDSIVGVSVRMTEQNNVPIPLAYVAIFKNIDPETLKPDTFMYYEFKKAKVVHDYDPDTSRSLVVTNDSEAELHLFVQLLKAAMVGLSNATAHASRYVDKYFRDRAMEQLDAMGIKVGLPGMKNSNGSEFGNSNSRSPRGDIFGGGAPSPSGNTGRSGGSRSDNSAQDIPSQSLNNIKEIDQFLGSGEETVLQ